MFESIVVKTAVVGDLEFECDKFNVDRICSEVTCRVLLN
jgi:hypothetical protein